MKPKPYIAAILAGGLAFTAALHAPAYPRIVSSARSFGHYFHAMESTVGSLGPVERFVYSLVLASNQAEPAEKPLPRT